MKKFSLILLSLTMLTSLFPSDNNNNKKELYLSIGPSYGINLLKSMDTNFEDIDYSGPSISIKAEEVLSKKYGLTLFSLNSLMLPKKGFFTEKNYPDLNISLTDSLIIGLGINIPFGEKFELYSSWGVHINSIYLNTDSFSKITLDGGLECGAGFRIQTSPKYHIDTGCNVTIDFIQWAYKTNYSDYKLYFANSYMSLAMNGYALLTYKI